MREDLEDLGPFVRTNPSQRRAGGRGGGGLEGREEVSGWPEGTKGAVPDTDVCVSLERRGSTVTYNM